MAEIDEEKDLALVERRIFHPHGLICQRYTRADLNKSKTPDFKIFKGLQHVAHCEVKSPRDDRLDHLLDTAQPDEIVGVGYKDSTFNRLARHIQDALKQFDAVDPLHKLPRILASVNHDTNTGFLDLIETLTGYLLCDGGEAFPMMDIAWHRLQGRQYRIDLYVMINLHQPRVESCVFTYGNETHTRALCDLLNTDHTKIKPIRP